MPGRVAPSPSEEREQSTSTSASPFLRLPLELREVIYSHALTRDQAFLWPSEDMPYGLAPALLATCRQVHKEACPLLYRLNRFSFKHPSDCNVFAHIMSRQHVRQIPKVGFHIRDRDTKLFTEYFEDKEPERSLAEDLPHLQYLIVFLTQSWPHNPNPDEVIKNWTQNSTLRKICMALDGKTGAEVTVLCSIRISEQLFEHLRRNHPEVLVPLGPGHMRTKAAELFGARVMLELLAPTLAPVVETSVAPE